DGETRRALWPRPRRYTLVHVQPVAGMFSVAATHRRREAAGPIHRPTPPEAATGQFRPGLCAEPARRLPRAAHQARRGARAAPRIAGALRKARAQGRAALRYPEPAGGGARGTEAL